MKKGLAIIVVLSLVCIPIFLSTGCMCAARAAQSAIAREMAREGITVQEDGESATLTQETDTGAVEMDWGSGDLPDGIPGEVPLYQNMNIEWSARESSSGDDSDSNSFQVIAQTTDPVEAVLQWHESQLEGWDSFSSSSWSSEGDVGHFINAQMGSMDAGRRLTIDLSIGQSEGDDMVTIGYYIEDTIAK